MNSPDTNLLPNPIVRAVALLLCATLLNNPAFAGGFVSDTPYHQQYQLSGQISFDQEALTAIPLWFLNTFETFKESSVDVYQSAVGLLPWLARGSKNGSRTTRGGKHLRGDATNPDAGWRPRFDRLLGGRYKGHEVKRGSRKTIGGKVTQFQNSDLIRALGWTAAAAIITGTLVIFGHHIPTHVAWSGLVRPISFKQSMMIIGPAVVGIVSLFSTKAFYRDLDRLRRKHIISLGAFRDPFTIKWKDKDTKEELSLTATVGFVDLKPETSEQMGDVTQQAERNLNERGLLPKNHALMVMEKIPKHYKAYLRLLRMKIRANPWTLIARDIHGRVIAYVVCVLAWVDPKKGVFGLPDKYEDVLALHKKHAGRRVNAWIDPWFTGGVNGALAEFMLDMSMLLAQILGLKYFIAYSNPRLYPKQLEETPDLKDDDYAARVIAKVMTRELHKIAKTDGIASWSDLLQRATTMTSKHATEDYSPQMAEKIVTAMQEFADQKGVPKNAQELTEFLDQFEESYGLGDLAITTHLKRGARLARIIPGAFGPILDGPGIGGGYAFVMLYEIPPLPDNWKIILSQWREDERERWTVPKLVLGGASLTAALGWMAYNRLRNQPKSNKTGKTKKLDRSS